MQQSAHSPPQARDGGLLCRDLPDGLMVYDEERHQAHSLNRTAAIVWRHCDGQTAIPELAHRLEQELQLPAGETMVWLALDRLEKAHLLQGPLARPDDPGVYSRRAVMQKLAKAGVAAAVIPLVASIRSPAAAASASPSTTTAQCQSRCADVHTSCVQACPGTGAAHAACVQNCNNAFTTCKAAC